MASLSHSVTVARSRFIPAVANSAFPLGPISDPNSDRRAIGQLVRASESQASLASRAAGVRLGHCEPP